MFEVANALWKLRRAGRVTPDRIDDFFHELRLLPIEIEREPLAQVFQSCAGLAHQLDLSVYDAAYLDLARREQAPLATMDLRLIEAAAKIGVERA